MKTKSLERLKIVKRLQTAVLITSIILLLILLYYDYYYFIIIILFSWYVKRCMDI
jgi:hypothetical protein